MKMITDDHSRFLSRIARITGVVGAVAVVPRSHSPCSEVGSHLYTQHRVSRLLLVVNGGLAMVPGPDYYSHRRFRAATIFKVFSNTLQNNDFPMLSKK